VLATDFEFRYRFFAPAAIFWLGFSLNWLGAQQTTMAEHLARLSGHPTRYAIQIVFALGALAIALGAAIRTWATAYLQGEGVHDMALHSARVLLCFVRTFTPFGV
jgi:hypothetical protein